MPFKWEPKGMQARYSPSEGFVKVDSSLLRHCQSGRSSCIAPVAAHDRFECVIRWRKSDGGCYARPRLVVELAKTYNRPEITREALQDQIHAVPLSVVQYGVIAFADEFGDEAAGGFVVQPSFRSSSMLTDSGALACAAAGRRSAARSAIDLCVYLFSINPGKHYQAYESSDDGHHGRVLYQGFQRDMHRRSPDYYLASNSPYLCESVWM
jgi:hypothetical protein